MELIFSVFTTIANWYGYYTIANLLKANFGLIVVLFALLAVCLLLYRLCDRQFPRPGRDSFKRWVFTTVIIFSISSFYMVVFFTIFYEVKKHAGSRHIQPAYHQSSVV